MAGMIIPDLTINYGGVLKIQCKAQVLYRREDKKKKVSTMVLSSSIMDVVSLIV